MRGSESLNSLEKSIMEEFYKFPKFSRRIVKKRNLQLLYTVGDVNVKRIMVVAIL